LIYPWVKKYVGIPFISNGRSMDGCDCYGLVRMVLKNEYGITLPDLSDNYSNALNVAETQKLFEKQVPVLTASRILEPEEKAIILLTEGGKFCHIGVHAGIGYILHTKNNTGSVCQRLTHPGLSGCIEGYYHVC